MSTQLTNEMDWKAPTNATIKLTISQKDAPSFDEKRILPASRVLHPTSDGCYERLVAIALTFSGSSLDCHVGTTYVDEDGDVITISSDEELVMAWQQFVNPVKPLRVTCVIGKREEEVTLDDRSSSVAGSVRLDPSIDKKMVATIVTEAETLQRLLRQLMTRDDEMKTNSTSDIPKNVNPGKKENEIPPTMEDNNKMGREDKQIPEKTSEHGEDEIPCLETNERNTLHEDDDKIIHDDEQISATTRNVAENDKPCLETYEKDILSEIEDFNRTLNDINHSLDGWDRSFLHARHTCDGCLTSPIVGLRYNSLEIPNYDLCQFCFDKYGGDKKSFSPEECDQDRAFQAAWKNQD